LAPQQRPEKKKKGEVSKFLADWEPPGKKKGGLEREGERNEKGNFRRKKLGKDIKKEVGPTHVSEQPRAGT